MGMAAFDGSICSYNVLPFPDEVVLTKDSRMTIVSVNTFYDLYCLLGDGKCSLKSETVQYELWHRGKSLRDYPRWVQKLFYDNRIFFLGGEYYFATDGGGEKLMRDNGVLLCNHDGDVTYIDIHTFNSLYTVIGGRL